MKKKNFLFSLVTATMLLWGMNVSAQTQVADFAGFDAAFQTMKTSGGGTIELTDNITINIDQNSVYDLSSDAADPIIINTGTFTINASTTATGTVDANNAILQIGDNVIINGKATVITIPNKTIVKVIGGEVNCSGATASRTISTDGGGKIWITGGKVTMDATDSSVGNPFAIYTNNYMVLTIEGGTISGKGKAGVRTVRVGTSSTATISGADISIDDLGGFAIFAGTSGQITIGSNTTVTASGTSYALNADAAGSVVVISRDAVNTTITAPANRSYYSTNSGGVFDLRDLALVVTPSVADPGIYTFPTPGTITVTATGASATQAPPYFFYTIGNAPVASPTTGSANQQAVATNTIGINFSDTYLKIRFGKGAWIDDAEIPLHYQVTTLSSIVYVSTLAELQAAYDASQLKPAGTTTDIELSAAITIPTTFTMTPDADHPINLNLATFNITLTGGSNTVINTFGGSLTVKGTNTSTLFLINGSPIMNFTGGSYTVNANSSIFRTETGGTAKTNAILRLSNSTFAASGTGATAGILNMLSGDFKEFTATDCTFNVRATSTAFIFHGGGTTAAPAMYTINNCTLNNSGTASVFTLGSGSSTKPMTVTIDGLNLTMASGNVFGASATTGDVITVIKKLDVTGAAVVSKPSGTAASKFYDFRPFSIIPTVADVSGQLMLTLTLKTDLSIPPIDANSVSIYYNKGDGTLKLAAADKPYTAPTPVSLGETYYFFVSQDGYYGTVSDPLAITGELTGITTPSIDAANAYIAGGTLYLPESGSAVQVYNVSGQLVLDAVATGATVDVSSLSRGIYIVKAGAATFKVVK
ncbi:MAG: T9SS type A sorting domain-containing protein [Candidatus Azobacteroides sp.]|nr:T9SS type A sorting domain-containing protein [Candidatus Azobacteroides sp.]